jgi:hypothetical protein
MVHIPSRTLRSPMLKALFPRCAFLSPFLIARYQFGLRVYLMLADISQRIFIFQNNNNYALHSLSAT